MRPFLTQIGLAAVLALAVNSAHAADTAPRATETPRATEDGVVPRSPGEENKGKPPIASDADISTSGAGSDKDAAATSPGEENKGKPQVAPQ